MGAAMGVRMTVETTFENGEKRIHQLEGISRPYRVTCPEGVGLLLDDGKRIIEQIQRAVICNQVDEITRESRVYPDCAALRAIHDDHTRDLDTRFGWGRVRVPTFLSRGRAADEKRPALPSAPITPRCVTGWEESPLGSRKVERHQAIPLKHRPKGV
jgi:hypothetical protein